MCSLMAEPITLGAPCKFKGFDDDGQAVFEDIITMGKPWRITISPDLWAELVHESVAAGQEEPVGLEFRIHSLSASEVVVDWENY